MSVELAGLDYDSLEKMIGSECYETALEYVRRKAVSQQIWIASQNALFGIVNGRHGDHYTPTVYFSRQGPVPAVKAVRCNCAASYGCEHAAALVIAAAAGGGAATGTAALGTVFPASALAGTLSGSRRGSWDASLESWLAAGREAGRTGEATLAIELTLEADQAGRPLMSRRPGQEHGFPGPLPVRLMARLVQPGKHGGWVGGSLSWGKLGGYGYYSGPSATQARLLRELVALYRTRVSSSGYYYPGGDERAIELSAIESSRLWPLLDEARQAGLPLVYRRKLGPVEGYREAELGLDVTGDEDGGGLAVTPVIRLDAPNTGPGPGSPAGAGSPAAGVAGLGDTGVAGSGGAGEADPGEAAGARSSDVVPVRFIGAQGHGLVYLDRAEAGRSAEPGDWRFRLARLRRAVPEPLQEMALGGQRLVIPAAGLARFREEFFPRLRQMATVTSSDGAFIPPDISGPTLVLCASYGAEHDVQVDWEWAYQVGDARLRSGLDASPEDTGYRDTGAELAILDRLALSGVLDGELASRAMAPGTRFRGLDTVRFTTELLPLLSRQPGLAVEITGDPADYREVSDSLCVSVSAEAVDGDPDWFDLGITLMAEGRRIPFADVFTALTLGQSHLLLPGGAYFSLDRPELRQLAQLIREARALQDAPGVDQLRISRFQAGLWAELTALGVVERQARAWQEQVQGLLDLGQASPLDPAGQPRPPGTLRAELRSYQLEGFRWLAFLWRHRLGGILADDMGLGKTLEALALICHARQADPDGAPFLVVAPTSVVPNWAAEAARFAPGLTVVTITDTLARRGAELSELIAGADLVVTSYTLLRLDFGAHATTGWSGLILDEAQYTKNHLSKIYQCARRLAAPVKIAITGTPMENNLMELWSLLSITAPGLFPEPERFRAFYARPIERQGDAELLARLRRRIRPLIMRRTKEQVAAELPDKQEQVLEVDLAPRHRKIYQTQLQRERQKVLRLLDDGDLNANRFTILSSLTRLRQLSLHAALIGDEHADVPCSKIDTLVGQILDVAAGGHRALVFSQFTRFLGYVRDRLDQAGVRHCYLDGKTRDRAAVLREFKEGTEPVFLISLKAGGFGLNLTEADYCFLLDPWWNPATEAQAVDRTHRIGQTRNVIVYRLIARDTIEEKVMALKARKGELFASVVDEGNVFGGRLDEDDIRGLLA